MGGDPVADKSGFLCMYMSNHPDTLVSYVRYWGKVSEQVASAKMTAIDTQGMTLTYQPKGSTATKEVRVAFDPPLLGYEEVKPRLMNMKGEAEEELGMTRAPQIKSFVWSSRYVVTTIAMSFLIYSTLASASGPGSPYASVLAPGKLILSYLPPWSLTFSWGMVGGFHGFEALYVLWLCRKHTGFVVGAQYVLACLALGFPVIAVLRKQVQDARIESIMKGQ